jgi:hypothetical protein
VSDQTQLTVFALIWLLGCGSGEQAKSNPAAASDRAASSAAATTVIAPAGGGEPIRITVQGDEIEVQASGRHVVGQTKGDKRFYHTGSIAGPAFVEVKISDAGFKLRTPDSQLLWKVKVADDKIKVSDNEENLNPWTLKTKYEDKVKVEDPTEREIGEVKFSSETSKTKVKDVGGKELYTLQSGKRSAAYGVLLMSAVPEQYRDVILAELLARGQ